MPMRGKKEVKEGKREPLQLFLWQNYSGLSLDDFQEPFLLGTKPSQQISSGGFHNHCFGSQKSGTISFSSLPLNQPSSCKAMWLPWKPQGRGRARQGSGSKSWTEP